LAPSRGRRIEALLSDDGPWLRSHRAALGLTAQTFRDGVAPNTTSQATAQIEITVEGLSAQILYAGLQPQYPGSDQIVLQLPQYTLPMGQTSDNFVITAPSVGQTLHYTINSR